MPAVSCRWVRKSWRAGITRILIAAADPLIGGFLEKGCRLHGFLTMVTDDRREVLELASSGEYDLLVVDSRLPDADGVRALRELRDGASRLPIVILSGHGRPGDRLADFGGSADDLLAKPFRFEQLLSRIHAHLGRASVESPRALSVGRATLDPEARLLILASESYSLDADELELALAFFTHPGETLSLEQLLADQPADPTESANRVLHARLGRLNRKVGRELIKPISRVEFRLDANGDEVP
jgi:DNA-binding response OmpR family regulator